MLSRQKLHQTICLRAEKCEELFEALLRTVEGIGKLYNVLRQKQDRFEHWAGYLGVFANQYASLDHRLAGNEDIRDHSLLYLEILQRNIQHVINFESLQNDCQRSRDFSSSSTIQYVFNNKENLLTFSSETLAALEGIDEAIDGLHRLGAAIRKGSSANITPRVVRFMKEHAAEFAFYKRMDLFVVKGLYSHIPLTFTEQLAESISFRRARLLYQRRHQRKLDTRKITRLAGLAATASDAVRHIQNEIGNLDTPAKSIPRSPKDAELNITKHSDFGQPSITDPTVMDVRGFKRYLTVNHGKVTEAEVDAPMTVSSVAQGSPYPRTPNVPKNKKHHKCEWCFQELKLPDDIAKWKQAWRLHFQQDLQPYVCISENCSESSKFFASAKTWRQHMDEFHGAEWTREIHEPTIWYCDSDSHDYEEFCNEATFREHLQHVHKGSFSLPQEDKMVKRQSMSISREENTCPLCLVDLSAAPVDPTDPTEQHELEPGSTSPKPTQPSRVAFSLPHCTESVDDHAIGTSFEAGQSSDQKSNTQRHIDHMKLVNHIAGHLKSLSFTTLRYFEDLNDDNSESIQSDDAAPGGRQGTDESEFADLSESDEFPVFEDIPIDERRPNDYSEEKTYFVVPYGRNSKFIGGTDILDAVEKALFPPDNHEIDSCRRIALSGPGGIGKTQLALEFAYRMRDRSPSSSIFWVSASTLGRLKQTFRQLAEDFQIPGIKNTSADLSQLLKGYLETGYHRPWLMIIDDVENSTLGYSKDGFPMPVSGNSNMTSDNLDNYIPNCSHGSVLVTTRNEEDALRLTLGNPTIMVGVLSESEAYDMIYSTLENNSVSEEEAYQLGSQLEYFPLAIAQASAYIVQRNISVTQYLRLLEESKGSHYRLDDPDTVHSHALRSIWNISFDQIQQKNRLAADLLSAMSLISSNLIPLDFAKTFVRYRFLGGVEDDEDEIDLDDEDETELNIQTTEVLNILLSFSMIREDEQDYYSMHQLIKYAMRERITLQGYQEKFAEEVLQTVSKIFSDGSWETWSNTDGYLHLARSALDLPLERNTVVRASLCHNLAMITLEEDRSEDAERFAVQAIEIREKIFGKCHEVTLGSMGLLVDILHYRSKWHEAEKLCVVITKMWTELAGEEDPRTLRSRSDLAWNLFRQSRHEDAEAIFKPLAAQMRELCGYEDDDTQRCLEYFINNYMEMDRLEEAQYVTEEVLEATRKQLGGEDGGTVRFERLLVDIYMEQDMLLEAEPLQEHVVEFQTVARGKEHPVTLEDMNTLVEIRLNRGSLRNAEELAVQTLDAHRRVLGERHERTLTTMEFLARIWFSMGNHNAALDLLERCIRFQQDAFGEEHSDVQRTMYTLERWRSQIDEGIEGSEGSETDSTDVYQDIE